MASATSRRDFLKTSGVFVVGFGAASVSGASPLGAAFQGVRISDIQVGNDQFEINVQYEKQHRDSLQDFADFQFMLADGQRLLWRGTAHDKAYPARNPAAEEKRIQTAVGRLLEQFPPQSGRDL